MKNLSHHFALLLLFIQVPIAQARHVPNLEFKDLAGQAHKLAELRGSIAVVNFWATWCGPCREELPLLDRLSKEHAAKHIRFIAISADEPKNRDKIDKFLAAQPLALEVWVGADLDALDRVGLGNELPATVVLDEQGEIVTRILGQAREEDLRNALEWELGNKTGTAPPQTIKHY